MIVLKAIAVFYVTWILYGHIMNLWKCKREGRLNVWLKVLGYPCLAVGYVFDVASNLIASVLLWHLPREMLLTDKLIRIQAEEPTGWRNRAAKWVCQNILSPLDPTGHHC